MRLKDKIAIITGSTEGIGKASAILFAKEGAKVVVNGRNIEKGKRVVEMIKAQGGEASFFKADVMVEDEVRDLIQFAVDTYGKFDIIFNNASVARFGPVGEMSTEDWNWAILSELTSVYYCCKYAIRHFLKIGGGVIVNTASQSGLIGVPTHGVHCATKIGIIGLTRSIAVDYGRKGIRCNALAPGPVLTEGQTKIWLEQKEIFEFFKSRQVADRIAGPDDIAPAALFLASDESRHLYGSVIVIDAGWHIS